MKVYFFSSGALLFYDLLWNSINEHCETDMSFPLHFTGLPDFQTSSATATAPSLQQEMELLPSWSNLVGCSVKKDIFKIDACSPVAAHVPGRWSGGDHTYHEKV